MSEQDKHGIDVPADHEDAASPVPSIEDFLEATLREHGVPGWDGLSTPPEQMRAQVEEHRATMKKEADIFRDTFSTAAGRQCLDMLLDRTLRRRVFGASFETQTLESLTVAAIVRETENNFVAAILEAIAFANNQEPTIRQEA